MKQQFHNHTQPYKKIKIVLLGDRAVGKSSIIKRFISNQFEENSHPTIGVDFLAKNIKYNNHNFRLQLWDTAGQEKYRSLVRGYLKGAHACIYVYDCTNFGSYRDLVEWIELFQSVAKNQTFSMIVGNKSDLNFDIEQLQASKHRFLHNHQNMSKLPEFQVSAKLGANINEIFQKILEHTHKQHFVGKQTQLGSSANKINCCKI